MKKEYSKPQIVFDSFELSQSIANCTVISNAVRNVCVYNDDVFGNIFIAAIDACDTIPQDDIYSGICYEVPTGSMNLFSS